MKDKSSYRINKLNFLRKMVRASAAITRQKNTIHFFTEIDVSLPLNIIDGAPAARFVNELIEEIKSGDCINDSI